MADNSHPQQLLLAVTLHDEATFDNFFIPANHKNHLALQQLMAQWGDGDEQVIFLWGSAGCGITHLLQACCHRAQSLEKYAQFLPLRDLVGYSPAALLEGMTAQDLLCIDSVDEIAGNHLWEEALFNLFNQMRDSGKRIILAANGPANELPFCLPDFQSRLNWGVTYHIESLDDDEKQAALIHRAHGRGMHLSEEVAKFILSRAPRDMNDLFYLLNRLDRFSLRAQRKLTIPLVKEALASRLDVDDDMY